MAETKYDNIQIVYDLERCREYNEVRKTVQKGIFRKRTVEVTRKVAESRGDARVRITGNVLGTLESVLHKTPQIAGVKKEDLPKILSAPSTTLLVSDEQGESLALLDYSQGIGRSGYCGSYMDHGGGIALTVFGDAIGTPEQFNTLQLRL